MATYTTGYVDLTNAFESFDTLFDLPEVVANGAFLQSETAAGRAEIVTPTVGRLT